MKKLLALLLAAVMVFALAACNGDPEPTEAPATEGPSVENPTEAPATEPPAPVYAPTAAQMLVGKEYGTDYQSLYDQFGKVITVNDVKEDEITGLAYIEVDGETYELGMDFLSMAMVYNTVADGISEDDAYAIWWKYYITRWNYLMPEIPLYSNEYYHVYNGAIKGVQEFPTNPYWSPASALIDWTSEKADGPIILGNTADLSGKFRYANFGANNPGAADLDVQGLVSGLDTVVTTKEGGYTWNETVVASHTETDNEDGTRTYTIKIHEDMVFSDGSPVTAKNYLYQTLVFSTPVAAEAAGKDHKSAMTVVGYDDYTAYAGEGAPTPLAGLRLLGDYEFSVTIAADYLPYYYAIAYAGFSPIYKDLWLGEFDIKDDGNGAYIEEGFFAKNGESYKMAAHISESALNTDTKYPYSGPYVVESYDEATKEAVLVKNDNFKGNYEGTKPGIAKVIYKMWLPVWLPSVPSWSGLACKGGTLQ